MNIGLIGLLVAFALFIVLMAVNPSLSCFGKRLKSPFYPLYRKRKMRERARQERVPPTGADEAKKRKAEEMSEKYGLKLD